jgi:hypothetical protein
MMVKSLCCINEYFAENSGLSDVEKVFRTLDFLNPYLFYSIQIIVIHAENIPCFLLDHGNKRIVVESEVVRFCEQVGDENRVNRFLRAGVLTFPRKMMKSDDVRHNVREIPLRGEMPSDIRMIQFPLNRFDSRLTIFIRLDRHNIVGIKFIPLGRKK